MKRILGERFFNRPTLTVAKELLGKYLVRKYPSASSGRFRNKEVVGMITETEAYDGFYDKASHASRGKTERNKIMFGSAGHWYVYFTYGMHWMLNIVTREKEYPAAVLIRGITVNADRRGLKRGPTLINGPARLTKYFKVDKKLNGKKANKISGLWIEDRRVKIPRSRIEHSPRIGVQYAGSWVKKPYRFSFRDGPMCN